MVKDNHTIPNGNLSIAYSGADYSAGVFVEKYKETMDYIGYSMDSGAQLWTTDGDQDALNFYASGYNAGGNQTGAAYAYGKLYVSGMSGLLYCYDLQRRQSTLDLRQWRRRQQHITAAT